MAEAAGIVLGGVPIFFELLDGAMKAYAFFMRVGDMEKAYQDLHTRLEMEQLRLLSFVEAAGLLEHEYGDDLSETVRQQRLVLVAVFKAIESKLDELAGLTKYQDSKGPAPDDVGGDGGEDQYDEFDLAGKYSTLKVKWSQGAKERAHRRGTNHIRKLYSIGKKAVTDPRRLRWAAHDQDKFERILGGLRQYTRYLEEMLHGDSLKRLVESQRRTEVEVVLVRNNVEDLQRLQQTMITLTIANQSRLSAMAGTKVFSMATSHQGHDLPPEYDSVIASTDQIPVQCLEIHDIPRTADVVALRQRTSARYRRGGEGNEVVDDVWIEWKQFATTWDDDGKAKITDASIARIKGLVALLQQSWQLASNVFAIPQCLGYFNLQDLQQTNAALKALPNLFGILYRKTPKPTYSIYRKPSDPGYTNKPFPNPVSLHSLFHSLPIPSLTVRARLGHQLASSLFYLNSVRWFHKALRSDAIVFHCSPVDGSVNLDFPFVTGFEFARPDSSSTTSTFMGDALYNALYVHPGYQRQTSANHHYRRSYDIYSLGIILLEITYWSPISDILRPEYDDGTGRGPSQDFALRVQNILLGKEGDCKTYILTLKETMGEKYYTAVLGCISGFEPVDKRDEHEPAAAVKEHVKFVEQVVDALGSIVI